MERVIPITPARKANHPQTGRVVDVVGVDTSGDEPRLVILVTDVSGTHAETVDFVTNRSNP